MYKKDEIVKCKGADGKFLVLAGANDQYILPNGQKHAKREGQCILKRIDGETKKFEPFINKFPNEIEGRI